VSCPKFKPHPKRRRRRRRRRKKKKTPISPSSLESMAMKSSDTQVDGVFFAALQNFRVV